LTGARLAFVVASALVFVISAALVLVVAAVVAMRPSVGYAPLTISSDDAQIGRVEFTRSNVAHSTDLQNTPPQFRHYQRACDVHHW
jgi:hypothetical protein